MTDRFSGKSFSDPQSENINGEIKARKYGQEDRFKEKKGKKEEKKSESNLSDLYQKGIKHLKTLCNYTIELTEGVDHCLPRFPNPR